MTDAEAPTEETKSDGCVYNYVVTAQSPTAVTHAAVGRITDAHGLDLIVGKSTTLELFALKKEGLQPVLESNVNGRIAAMEVFRQPGDARDSVLLLTERMNMAIIKFDPVLGEWQTVSSGCVQQRIGNEAKNGPLAFLDPNHMIVGLHLYDGQLRIASIVNGNFCNIFNIAMAELNILHMCFLSAVHLNSEKPVLAVLFEDTRHVRHLKTYVVDIEHKELEDAPWFQTTVAIAAEMIIPVNLYGGLLLVGESVISYFSSNQTGHSSIAVHETKFNCYAKIDEERYLLSDHMGTLHILQLMAQNGIVEEISWQRLGDATPASCMAYLDSGIFFLGSKHADSQLIKLVPGAPTESPVRELSRFTNLGPVLDFCVVDLERQGQCQIVTCSGAFAQGSLRIIRNGIGIMDQVTIPLTGIKGLWSLRRSFAEELDAFLVISFVSETRMLAFSCYNPDELSDAQIPGFQGGKQTLHCANMIYDTLLQVTQDEAALISCESWQRVACWQSSERRITVAASSPSQVLVGYNDCEILYLHVGQDELKEGWRFRADDEVSCLDLTPIGDDAIMARFAVVGTWDRTLLLLDLNANSVVSKLDVSQDVIPRSVLLSMFEGAHYLLVAMGDGRLLTYEIDSKTGRLTGERRISIGTKPVTLSRFRSKGTSHVFASSDRPTVIYGEQKKLMFSNLNEQNVNFLTSFSTASAPECLALAQDDGLMIGTIDDIQKLHIKTIHLKEMPRRICHQPQTHSYGVLVESYLPDGRPQSYFRIFDDETFEVKASVAFDYTETGISILSLNLPERQDGTKKAPYFIVGTVYVVATEQDSYKGRLLAFSYEDIPGQPNLTPVAEKEFNGAVFSLKPIMDRILLTVNSKVHIVEWCVADNGTKNLNISCTQYGHIMAVYSAVRGNFILIGDLMRSISLLIYDREKNELEARAKDPNNNWMTALLALDDDVFLGAENSYNLFTVKKVATRIKDEEARLEPVGQYHLGEHVNALREGSLVADSELNKFLRPPVLFGTISGQIGLILSLTSEQFVFLEKLQSAMEKVIRPLGMFDHSEYRRFWNERQSKEVKNFIDGDLIETFLDLKKHDMDAVAALMKTSSDEIYKIVEELSKLH